VETTALRSHAPVRRRRLSLASRSRQILTVLGFATPTAIYLWFLHHYTVNAIWWDQWSDALLIRDSYDGRLSFATLWAQHNENRIFFPNLLVLAMSRLDSFNVSVEEYVSGALLLASVALIIGSHKRRSPERRWLAYCPVAILMLSVVQAQNILWGFQLAWYVVLVTLSATVFLLDRKVLSSFTFLSAVVLAIIGSFSSLQGLLIWVAGLILLFYRRRPPVTMALWSAVGLITIVGYFFHFNSVTPANQTAVHLPSQAIRYFFESIGDVLGMPLTTNDIGAYLVGALGCVIVILAVLAVWSGGRHRDSESGAPLGVALIVVGLLFALATTYGRARGWPQVAVAGSRYTTFDLLILVGIYLVYICDRRISPASNFFSRARREIGVVLGAVIALVAVFGLVNGIRWARSDHQTVVYGAAVTVDANNVPGPILQRSLYLPASAQQLRQAISALAAHKLSLFSDPQAVQQYRQDASELTKAGAFRYTPPPPAVPTRVLSLKAGAVLSGTIFLVASAEKDLHPVKVDFVATGGISGERVIATGKESSIGWIALWKTTNFPNGAVQIESVVTSASGRVTQSQPVNVTIRNARAG
jgi:hypothetical protein